MSEHACPTIAVGSASNEGKQFLKDLEATGLVTILYQTCSQFLQSKTNHLLPAVVLVENSETGRKDLQHIRKGNRPCYVIAYGNTWTKEQLAFALENRVYAVWEPADVKNPAISAAMASLSKNESVAQTFEGLVQSLKVALVSDNKDKALDEVRHGVSKMEKLALKNELCVCQGATPPILKAPLPGQHDLMNTLATVEDLERTGTLWIKGKHASQEGSIDFIQGQMVSVTAGETKGLKAFFRMCLWEQSSCLFSHRPPTECTVDDLPTHSFHSLFSEAETHIERFKPIENEAPPPDIKIGINNAAIQVGIRMSREDFSTLASVIEFKGVREILDYNPHHDITLYESLIRLRKSGLLTVA